MPQMGYQMCENFLKEDNLSLTILTYHLLHVKEYTKKISKRLGEHKMKAIDLKVE